MATLDDKIAELGSNEALGQVTHYVEAVRRALLGNADLRRTLEGRTTTGSPLHPALVHFPIGGSYGAATLDLLGLGVGAGVLSATTAASALAAAATGLADYGTLDDESDRRVGAAHYLAAMSGAALTLTSLGARVARRPGLARLTLLGACAAFTAAGAVGGHLVYGQPELSASDAADATPTE